MVGPSSASGSCPPTRDPDSRGMPFSARFQTSGPRICVLLHNGCMAEDEIERLLREINATTGQPPAQPGNVPARQPDADVARSDGSSGSGRLAFAAIAGVVLGAGSFIFGVFTPWTDALDMGMAGATAAFLTGLVAGPPKWFSS